MLTTDSQERRTGCCVLTDLDGEGVAGMLEFLYGRSPSNIWRIADSLLYAADKYEIQDLKNVCVSYLVSNLSPEVAVDVLILAEQHSAFELLDQVLIYIANHKKDSLKDDGVQKLFAYSAELAKKVLQSFV